MNSYWEIHSFFVFTALHWKATYHEFEFRMKKIINRNDDPNPITQISIETFSKMKMNTENKTRNKHKHKES